MSNGPDIDFTMAAIGTSVTWGTGNHYENKFVDLVHRDLTGDYPLGETYLHYNTGSKPSEPRYPYDRSDPDYPEPSYYEQTKRDGYTAESQTHPRGPHIPPSQYRARGGGIMGLSWPGPVLFGGDSKSDVRTNDQGGYLTGDPAGEYDGKVDGLGVYPEPHDDIFSNIGDINESAWLAMRDLGWGWPTIPDQMKQFGSDGSDWQRPADMPRRDDPSFGFSFASAPPAGTDVDLVIVDGGTNDLQLGWINNPAKAGRQALKNATKRYLYDDMTGRRGLLRRTRRAFPNAIIVLLGYPVWTSNRTDKTQAAGFLRENSPVGSFVVEAALDNPLNFSHFQAHWLRQAVAEEAARDDGPGIIFAQPPWGVINSMMADWPWSYGFDAGRTGKQVNPRDDNLSSRHGITPSDTLQKRVELCDAERNWEWDNEDHCDPPGAEPFRRTEDCEIDPLMEYAAPIGHPNNEGSRQYANTIVRRYKEYINLDVGDVAEDLDDGTNSLRRSLHRYGLDSMREDLRWLLSHRVIDSIRVDTETESGQGMGQKKGDVSLSLHPGRSGSGESFRLDTEYNDHKPGGTDQFFIDPMMKKRISGPIGNVDHAEFGPGTGKGEPSYQNLEPEGHWSERRLRLGDIEYVTIVTDGLDPIDGWDLTKATIEINGSIERTRNFSAFDNKDVRGDREFLLASFNRVAGVSASDIDTTIRTNLSPSLSSSTDVEVTISVINRTDKRIPSLPIQCGMRIDGNGGDWQVVNLGELGPGASKSASISMEPTFDPRSTVIYYTPFIGHTTDWQSITATGSQSLMIDDSHNTAHGIYGEDG